MRYFFEETPLFRKIKVAGKIALFLDFDGTLVPIQKDPKKCFLSKPLKKLLLSLFHSRSCYLIVLSGRALSDIKKRVGIASIFYGGNHGLDISGPGIKFTHPAALSSKLILKHITLKLKKDISNIKGTWLENKKFTLSLHFRSVSTEYIKSVKNVFYNVVDKYLKDNLFTVIKGKKVLELVPNVLWDKGKASSWILKSLKTRCLPVYVGDDYTDETAFKTLHRKGIAIRIGKSKKSLADYYLKGQWEISNFLKQIQNIIIKTEKE